MPRAPNERERRSRIAYGRECRLRAGRSIESVNRTRLWWEIGIVLALGLGQSAVYAIVQLAYRLTDSTPLADQTATLKRVSAGRR